MILWSNGLSLLLLHRVLNSQAKRLQTGDHIGQIQSIDVFCIDHSKSGDVFKRADFA